MLSGGAMGGWTYDWLWGLSLLVLSVLMHAAGLGMIALGLKGAFARRTRQRSHHPVILFSGVVALTSLLLAILHAADASLWAVALVWLGAAPDFRRAIYFS